MNNNFNGWYFRNTKNEDTISFIVGETSNEEVSYSFIQIIDTITNKSYDIHFNKSEFKYNKAPFFIMVGDNYFSKEKIIINISDDEILIKGELYYSDITPIYTSLYAPNIMGPFGYFKMECNHEIVSLCHHLSGTLTINNKDIVFDDGTGYIERDYGTSFPKNYTWIQSNSTDNCECCLFFSIAKIPIYRFSFQGLICIFYVNNKEYRFSSYYLAKTKVKRDGDLITISIKQGWYKLEIVINYEDGNPLLAPNKGYMNKTIEESLKSRMIVKLFMRRKLLVKKEFYPVAVEHVK